VVITVLRSLLAYGRWAVLTPPSTTTFPQLVELSLCFTRLPQDFFTTFPSSNTTPALRVLGIATPGRFHLHSLPSFRHFKRDLLEQLDVLHLDARDRYYDTYSGGLPSPNLVVDVYLGGDKDFVGEQAPSLPSFVRLYRSSSTSTLGHDEKWMLEALSERFLRPPSSSTAESPFVILPLSLRDVAEHRAVRELLDVVIAGGGEVLWEETPSWECQSLVSMTVWRRVRTRMLERAAEG
jgi:hypothetical protein